MADKKNVASGKSEKTARKKGARVVPAIKKFFRDLKGELKKIIWPNRQTIVRNTIATLVMCVVIGLFVSLFDLGLSAFIKLLLSL